MSDSYRQVIREAVAAYQKREEQLGRPFPGGSGWCIAEAHSGHKCLHAEYQLVG